MHCAKDAGLQGEMPRGLNNPSPPQLWGQGQAWSRPHLWAPGQGTPVTPRCWHPWQTTPNFHTSPGAWGQQGAPALPPSFNTPNPSSPPDCGHQILESLSIWVSEAHAALGPQLCANSPPSNYRGSVPGWSGEWGPSVWGHGSEGCLHVLACRYLQNQLVKWDANSPWGR